MAAVRELDQKGLQDRESRPRVPRVRVDGRNSGPTGLEYIQSIVKIAKASKNLKGTTVKEIYVATHSLNSIMDTLVRRATLTSSDFVKALDDTVRSQRKQLAEVKRSNSNLREENEDLRKRLKGEMPPPRKVRRVVEVQARSIETGQRRYERERARAGKRIDARKQRR